MAVKCSGIHCDQNQHMKILVTGADEFIGSRLTEALVRQGHEVRAFTLCNSFNSWGWLHRCADDVCGNFKVFHGGARDQSCMRTAMNECEAVLLLAALIARPYSYHSPDEQARVPQIQLRPLHGKR